MIAVVAAIQQSDLRSSHSCHRKGIAKIDGACLNLNWVRRESLWTTSRHDFKQGVGIRKGKWTLVLQARHSQEDLEDDLGSDREVGRRRG